MVEKDFRSIQKTFRDIVGPVATAEISKSGAIRSADIIVEIDNKIYMKNTQPIDLFRATIATSQLVQRWGQIEERFMLGSISSVDDDATMQALHEKFSGGNLTREETMRLTKIACVACPYVGANKAMEVLAKLRTIYEDVSIHQPYA